MYKDIIDNIKQGLLSFLEPDSKFMPISHIKTKLSMWLALWQKTQNTQTVHLPLMPGQKH